MSSQITSPEALSALESLRAALSKGVEPNSPWLDAHRGEIVSALDTYGPKRTSEMLDIKLDNLNKWRRRRGLQDDRSLGNAKAQSRTRVIEEGDEKSTLDVPPRTPVVNAEDGYVVMDVDTNLILPNPWQPRRSYDPLVIRELAESIYANGLLQTPVGRPAEDEHVELAFGHQRIEAIRLLQAEGRWDGGAPVVLRNLTDQQMVFFAFEENLKRRDLSPLDEYMGYRKALEEVEGLTITALAQRLGMDRSTLSNNLRILRLPPVALDRFASGELSAHAAREFLCLMNDDHAHVDDMAWVVNGIARSSGHTGAPDWRGDNVRRLIRERVAHSNSQNWRGLDASEGSNAGNGAYNGDLSLYPSPTFDVELFKKENASAVHNLPKVGGAAAWTCDVREWRKRQAAGTREANRARDEEGAGGAPSQSGHELASVLRLDPVMQAIEEGREVDNGSVSTETRAEAVEEATAGDQKGEEYRRLNRYLGERLDTLYEQGGVADEEWGADYIRNLLELTELTDQQVESAVEGAVQAREREEDREVERRASLTEARGLEDAQREKLGTRAQLVDLGRYRGWYRSLGGYQRSYPFGFPDVDECLTRCTWGATYGKEHPQIAPRLFCLNRGHWEEKQARGLEEKRREIREHAEAESAYDQGVVEEVVRADEETLFRELSKAIMGLQGYHALTLPGGAPREFAYERSTSRRVREILGLELPEESGGVIACDFADVEDLEDRLRRLGAPELRELVGQLVAYSQRNTLEEEE